MRALALVAIAAALPMQLSDASPANELPDHGGAAPPTLDLSPWLPDLDALARWPLGFNEHPIFEPSFDIAGALADPGVTWRELCARGVQFSHRATGQDLIAYLKAWCTEVPADALYQLGLLQNSSIHGIAAAIAADASRIVVGRLSADEVEGALIHAHLLQSSVVDLVAASYYEIGKLDAALEIDKLAADIERGRHEDSTCRRLVRTIVATTGERHDAYRARLHELATPALVPPVGGHAASSDPVCVDLDQKVACTQHLSISCVAPTVDVATRELIDAYDDWPWSTNADGWHTEYTRFRAVIEQPLAIPLAIRAIELELEATQCQRKRLASVAWDIRELRRLVPRDATRDAIIDSIEHDARLPPTRCAEAVLTRD